MAITTGAADAGVLNLDRGSRPRSGNSGGGDSFANALDTQMQKPRSERPRSEPRPGTEAKPKQGAENTREKEAWPAARESATADDKPAENAASAAEPGAGKEEAAPTQGVIPMLLQTSPEPVAAAGPGADTGKDLPQAAADEAAKLLSATVQSQGGGDKPALTEAVATTPVARAIDPRLASPSTPVTEMTALEDPALQESGASAQRLVARAADAPASAAGNLMQAGRMAAGAQAVAAQGDKPDAFAATLAALRDLAPRASGDGTAPASVPLSAPAGAVSANAAPSTAAPTLPPVNVPVGQNGWDQVVGERILWMTRQGMQEAKIELNPRDLGPLEVRVSVQQDQASVSFTAHTPAAREALEAAMPRLREMLADSGLNLAQSDVSHGSPQQQQESGWGAGGQQGAGGSLFGGGGEDEPVLTSETPVTSQGAVDYYA